MNLNDLQELVDGGESDRLEFKSCTGQRTAAAKTICAMLNGPGGMLLFGVSDQGRLLGQEVSNRTQEDSAPYGREKP